MSQVMASSMSAFLGSSAAAAAAAASTRLAAKQPKPAALTIRAHQHTPTEPSDTTSSRRALLSIVAAGIASGSFVQAVLAEAKPIKIGPPPPPSGGLPGTLNSDIPRDLDLPLKDRFFIQPLAPKEAAQRAKESAQDIINVKESIAKKAWPYVQMDLRLKAELLRYDLKTVISAKPKEEKKALNDLSSKLFQTISDLDHAAKIKSSPEAEKYYAQTVSALNDVLAKLG